MQPVERRIAVVWAGTCASCEHINNPAHDERVRGRPSRLLKVVPTRTVSVPLTGLFRVHLVRGPVTRWPAFQPKDCTAPALTATVYVRRHWQRDQLLLPTFYESTNAQMILWGGSTYSVLIGLTQSRPCSDADIEQGCRPTGSVFQCVLTDCQPWHYWTSNGINSI